MNELNTAIKIVNKYKDMSPYEYENVFLRKVNDKTILEIFFSNNKKLPLFVFNNEESLKLILKYKKYNLLSRVTLRNFLRIKRKNRTYLEYILKQYLYEKNFDVSFFNPFNQKCTLKEVADFYLIYEKYGLEKYLPELTDDYLKYKDKNIIKDMFNVNDSFLEVLLKRADDPNKAIDKLISKDKVKDIDILLALNKYKNNYVAKINIKDDLADSYIEKYYDKYDSLFDELSDYDKKILSELKKSMSKYSDDKAILTVINSYIEQLSSGHNEEIYDEIDCLIAIFRLDNTFRVVMRKNSYYDPDRNEIGLSKGIATIFNHELGHLLLHKSNVYIDYKRFNDILIDLQNSKEVFSRIINFASSFGSYRKLLISDSNSFYDQNKKLDEDEINKYLEIEKIATSRYYSKQGYSKSILNSILNKSYTKEEYLSQYKKTQIDSLCSIIGRIKISQIFSFSDIIDAIYEGNFSTYGLKDSNGKKIESISGHNLFYFNNITSIFNEVFANYVTIKKSIDNEYIYMNSKENNVSLIDILRYITSDELVDFLENLYLKVIDVNNYMKGEKNYESQCVSTIK